MNNASVPAHLQYTAEHEWVDLNDDIATVGITAFAANALGDVVFVDLPEAGATVTAGEACGEIESTKSVSELYAPVSGRIVAVNDAAIAEPAVLNTDPFAAGWLFRVEVTAPATGLLDAAAYEALTRGD
jgi:glycine cleavage system H protein